MGALPVGRGIARDRASLLKTPDRGEIENTKLKLRIAIFNSPKGRPIFKFQLEEDDYGCQHATTLSTPAGESSPQPARALPEPLRRALPDRGNAVAEWVARVDPEAVRKLVGQTGRLASQGYQLAQMQTERAQLLRQRSALQLQLSEAASLLKIDQRASALRLRPMTPDQAHYVTVVPSDSSEQEPGNR